MLILTLDSAAARTSAAVLDDDRTLAADIRDMERGTVHLATMARAVLREAGIAAARLDLIAVTVGPGGFTGIRGALALAHGIGLAAGVAVIGVTVPEALAADLPAPVGRDLWVAIAARSGRVFLGMGGAIMSVALDDLPHPDRPIALIGDAAAEVAARLLARGTDAIVIAASPPAPLGIARAGQARRHGLLPALDPQPLYIDPPEARPPAGGPRPAPA